MYKNKIVCHKFSELMQFLLIGIVCGLILLSIVCYSMYRIGYNKGQKDALRGHQQFYMEILYKRDYPQFTSTGWTLFGTIDSTGKEIIDSMPIFEFVGPNEHNCFVPVDTIYKAKYDR